MMDLGIAIIIFMISCGMLLITATNTEFETLMDFRWPYANSTHHCEWNGITCDDGGRVEEITLQHNITATCHYWLEFLDVLAFPYLNRIHVASVEPSHTI